jgi:hypothetical protein
MSIVKKCNDVKSGDGKLIDSRHGTRLDNNNA